jgi:hypothetical protein
VRQDTGCPELLRDVAAIQAGGGSGNILADTFRWVKSRLQFVMDEQNAAPLQPAYTNPIVEVLVRPRDVSAAGRPIGDCDDYTMYGAALLRTQGVPVNIATVAADPTDPKVFSHVYVVAYPGGVRTPMDFSHGDYVGWETDHAYRYQEWEVDVPTKASVGASAALLALGIGYWLYTKTKTKRN